MSIKRLDPNENASYRPPELLGKLNEVIQAVNTLIELEANRQADSLNAGEPT